jgi:hypothetical protein
MRMGSMPVRFNTRVTKCVPTRKRADDDSNYYNG